VQRTNKSKQEGKKHEAILGKGTKTTKEKQYRKRNEGNKVSIPELRDLVARYFS
jgi:hypothetical protein